MFVQKSKQQNVPILAQSIMYADPIAPSLSQNKSTDGTPGQILAFIMSFAMALLTLLHTLTGSAKKKLQQVNCKSYWRDAALVKNLAPKEFQPSSTHGFTEANLPSPVLKRLDELEKKFDILQSKPLEMPHEKAELLSASVRRVDALEAELIATKKALYDSLMRQEELLAYIDRHEEAKIRKKKRCC